MGSSGLKSSQPQAQRGVALWAASPVTASELASSGSSTDTRNKPSVFSMWCTGTGPDLGRTSSLLIATSNLLILLSPAHTVADASQHDAARNEGRHGPPATPHLISENRSSIHSVSRELQNLRGREAGSGPGDLVHVQRLVLVGAQPVDHLELLDLKRGVPPAGGRFWGLGIYLRRSTTWQVDPAPLT